MIAVIRSPSVHNAVGMAVRTNKETTSFKLLEEDNLEEKPTPHMKKVVGLVLEKKDLKDEDVTNSFRNLMEYREAPPSPSASSASALEPEGLGSPTTPSSPVPQPVDDERLPNELLDEICEDIGMKEGMELDFVEFLMEQDMPDPHSYMTPEAIMNSSSFSSGSQTSISTVKQVSSGTRVENWGRPLSSPIVMSSTVTSGTSTVVSSGASSPVSKRFHPSTSGESSPTKSTAPPLPQSPQVLPSQVFKMPQTPPTPKRPLSSGNAGRQSPSVVPPSSHCDDSSSRDTVPLSHCPMTPSKTRCYSPKPNLPSCSQQSPLHQKHIPQSPNSLPCNQSGTLHYGQSHQIGSNRASSMQKSATATNYQRLGKPAPPVVNVQNMQHLRMMNPKAAHTNVQGCDSLTVQTNSQYGRSLDSLDQGYFSGDTGSVRSYGSNMSMGSADQLHVKTEDVSSMIPSIQQSNSVQPPRVATVGHVQMPPMPPIPQKSVHFADMPGSEPGSECQNQQGVDYNGGFNSECGFDLDQEFRENSQKSKILPRISASMKSEVAPYTVPGGSPYDFSNRSSCGVNPGSRPGSGGSPAVNMQQFDFSGKGQENNMYYVDNNQNMLRVETGDFNQMGAYQQNQTYAQQMNAYRGMSVTDSMKASSMAQLQQQNEMYRNQMSMQSGNYDNSCSVAGMNQGANRMMGANQVAGTYNQQQAQQGSSNNQQQFQQPPSSCSTPRIHTQANSTVTGPYSTMPSTSGYDHSMYNNGSQTPSRNMHPQMYQGQQQQQPQQQHAGNMGPGNPQPWSNQGTPAPQTPQNLQELSHLKQTPQNPMQQMMPPSTPQNPQCSQSMQPGTSPMVPCTIPNCQSCKTGSPHRPPMLASQQTFIQHLITDRSNAFRSHPLFPLLRDLIIADMNFASPSFPYQLISNLPAEFDKLLQNFLHRNPPTGNYQGNFAVESVIMDALRYAHQCLIEKIRVRQEQDKHTKATSKSLSAIEEFCEKFDRAVRNSIPEQSTSVNHGNPMMLSSGQMGGTQMAAGPMGSLGVGQVVKDPKYMMDPTMTQEGFIPAMGKGIGLPTLASPQFRSIKEAQDALSEAGSAISNNSNHSNKSESKKHPSLPKEAVAIMLEWLRNHKDNPYPNDDEKAMLIKQTGLTINQINYWFTNARRRILPKWAQCK
ncbi:uncharacterized protein [Haliotis asinina]|uniref:uncharacterized protein isoform X1 n=3 Tax=Haliotis asinina TaxID=109174 RepID=UPI003531F860